MLSSKIIDKRKTKPLPPKERGAKPPSPTIEDKKQNLKQKYGIL